MTREAVKVPFPLRERVGGAGGAGAGGGGGYDPKWRCQKWYYNYDRVQ